MQNVEYVNHEVRIQLLEKISEKIDDRFQHLENKIDSHFRWMLGTFFGVMLTVITMGGGAILTKAII